MCCGESEPNELCFVHTYSIQLVPPSLARKYKQASISLVLWTIVISLSRKTLYFEQVFSIKVFLTALRSEMKVNFRLTHSACQ